MNDTESEPNISTNKGNEDACNSTKDENAGKCKNNREETAQDSDNNEERSGPVVIDEVADSDFYDFDMGRSEECFACDQIWAIFDELEGMPRLYARINKVHHSPFKVDITWLEFVAGDMDETAWKTSGLPVTCGVFKHEKTDTIEDIGTFSHKIVWEKGVSDAYKIYPRKGEIWALYKNWSITWSSDLDNHRDYAYEFVVVLSDYTKKSGILVSSLVKLKGFVCLFKPTQNNGMASFQVPFNEMLRFSHRVPSFRTNGRERKDVPEGYFELDPASLPDNLEDVYDFVDGKEIVVGKTNCSLKSVLENTPMPMKREICSSDCVTDVEKSISEKIPSSNTDTYKLPEPEFRIFDDDRTEDKFLAGQVWSLYCELDGLPKYYARINKVELIPKFKVNVQWLEACTPPKVYLHWLDNKMPTGCGYYFSDEYMEFHDTLSFSHLSNATVASKTVEIFPKEGEVWAIYRNLNSEWSSSDLQTCKYDVCEVVLVDYRYKVLILEKVSDYETVFKTQTRAGVKSFLEVQRHELLRFSHQIPAIQLTDEKEGTLRGCWELDPKAIPVCLFSSVSSTSSKETSSPDQAGAKLMGSDGGGTSSNIVAAEQSPQGPLSLDSCETAKAQSSTMAGKRKSLEGNSSTGMEDAYKEKRTEEISGQPPCKRNATIASQFKV